PGHGEHHDDGGDDRRDPHPARVVGLALDEARLLALVAPASPGAFLLLGHSCSSITATTAAQSRQAPEGYAPPVLAVAFPAAAFGTNCYVLAPGPGGGGG